jgi:hypothetical protein
VASCKQSHAEAEDKKIADAVLSTQKMETFKQEFWDAYPRSSPLLSMCLRNGNYAIDRISSTELHDQVFKITVIDWKYPVVGDAGNDHARGLAQYMEGQLLDRMTQKAGVSSKMVGGFSEMMAGAASWLKSRRCNADNGILVSTTKRGPSSELYRDKDFVWSSKEESESLGLDGFYKGFPVVWLRDEGEPAEESQEGREPRREQVIAIDLGGWKGITVRDTVITERKFGELTIRTWSDEEIQEAKASGKLEGKDEDKAKGSCPVEICLHWQLNRDKPPRAKPFEAVTG